MSQSMAIVVASIDLCRLSVFSSEFRLCSIFFFPSVYDNFIVLSREDGRCCRLFCETGDCERVCGEKENGDDRYYRQHPLIGASALPCGRGPACPYNNRKSVGAGSPSLLPTRSSADEVTTTDR
mmetsp:Transcript_29470/g.66088  ORF Transcript_29470/g.66088 Transcript_29470/m.66088 type:complete len:124 (-) Transcript_29470:79-450(-)